MRSICNNENFRWTITSRIRAWDPPSPRCVSGNPSTSASCDTSDHPSLFFLAAPHALRFLLAQSHGLCCAPATDQSFLFYACEEQIIPAGLFRNKGGGQQQMPCSWWLSICIFFLCFFLALGIGPRAK